MTITIASQDTGRRIPKKGGHLTGGLSGSQWDFGIHSKTLLRWFKTCRFKSPA